MELAVPVESADWRARTAPALRARDIPEAPLPQPSRTTDPSLPSVSPEEESSVDEAAARLRVIRGRLAPDTVGGAAAAALSTTAGGSCGCPLRRAAAAASRRLAAVTSRERLYAARRAPGSLVAGVWNAAAAPSASPAAAPAMEGAASAIRLQRRMAAQRGRELAGAAAKSRQRVARVQRKCARQQRSASAAGSHVYRRDDARNMTTTCVIMMTARNMTTGNDRHGHR